MGAYGTPEHLPPLKPEFSSIKWVCRACKMEYHGNYCPYCGTKAGKPKNWWFLKKIRIFTVGMIAGVFFLFLGFFIGKFILKL